MTKKHDTPHRTRVVKTRMTEEEYEDFTSRLSQCNISQSEFIRQAISKAVIRPVITVSSVNDELLSSIGKLTSEYGKTCSSLNRIASYLNKYGALLQQKSEVAYQ